MTKPVGRKTAALRKSAKLRAEIARKERENRDRAVIDALSDNFGSVIYTSYETYREVCYRSDPFFERHIGDWNRIENFKERLARITETLVHPEDRQHFWEATRPETVKQAIETEGVCYVNFRILAEGRESYYQIKFVRDDVSPGSNVIVGIRSADAEIRREMRSLEAEKDANRAKTNYLYNLSHDIRTPMNAIMGFMDMAIRHAEEPERVTDCLQKSRQAGELLLDLVNDILDMSRIESGRIVLSENKGDICRTFSEIEAAMRELAAAKNISLSFRVENVKDRYVYCDIARCTRILVNLITNAIKYTEPGGTVSSCIEQTGAAGDRGFYRVTVKDNGIGMSPEFLARAFDEFARENPDEGSGERGTGLGLSVCRSFVQAMQGTIECTSEKGRGSVFTVNLPLRLREAAPQPKAERKEKLQAPGLRGRRVLLAEDNPMNREIAVDLLTEEGMLTETAENGAVAVKLLQLKGPEYYDFVLMDIQMPVMDGLEAAAAIRRMYPRERIPIIALSANAFAEDKTAALRAGMNAHVAKPVRLRELEDTMLRYDRKRNARPEENFPENEKNPQ